MGLEAVMNCLYCACAAVSCFDDASDAATAAAAAAAAALANDTAAAAAAAAAAKAAATKVLTQEEFNAALVREVGKERAKHEATLKQALDSKNLTEQERADLNQQLNIVRGEAKTKEVQAAEEKKALEEKYKADIEAKTKESETWATLFRESNVTRDLQGAAVAGDAYNAEQIITLLKPMTKMVEIPDEKTGKGTGRYRTVVEFPDKDPVTGDIVPTAKTPEEAIKRMRELPEKYGNLFKSNVRSGIGANSSADSYMGAGGTVDLQRLARDPKAFREAVKANPNILNTK